MKKQMKLLTCLTKPFVLFLMLFTLGVGQMWADTWLYGSFQEWVAKDNNYKFTYDGSVGNYYLELEANTEYEFKIIDGDNYYSYTNQNFTTTTTDYIIYTDNQNCKITTGEAGVYIFKTWWADNQRHMAVYFPQARLKKGSYLYVDARNTNWVNNDGVGFGARYFYKYYDSGMDLSSGGVLDCTTPLEYQVHYTIVPDNDYVGQVQIERKNPADMNGTRWDYANNIAAFSRSSSKQNCLSMEYATGDTWSGFTPLWTTYCPIKATSSISDNGTVKTWGGAGTSESPYYVSTGSKIKVSSSSTDHISDANMTTKYDFEVRNASDVQQTHSDGETTTYEYTVPATNDVVYKVRVNSYNYYNSTSSTANWSSDIYYKARTPYTISYNAGTGGSGERASETKLKDVTFALPNSAIFTRTGYTQTGWTKSNLGSQTHALGANYTDNSDQAFYPAWTPNPYTITLNDHDATSAGTSGVNVTFDANTNLTSAITIPKKTGYGFQGYYTEESGAGTQIIDAEGNFIAGAGSNAYLDGSKNWKYANNITLHAYWVASAVTTPTVTASMPAYIGEDVTITLSATSTNVAEPVVIFEVADNSNSTTYEVVATPGAKGSMPTYSTTHTATFTAKHAATYTVTAKVYSGKLIDNFDGSLAYWKALGGGSFNASATNPAIQAGNGSNTVMQITRGDETWKTVQTKKAANDESTTNWNLDYDYIYMSMYSTTARTPKLKYSDDDSGYEVALDANSLSANTWQRKQFATTHDIDYILPFMPAEGTMYIDDIILSNESSMTAQATSSSASTTITQPTIGSCTATAATTNWGGSNINISLSAQTTYLADAVVVFFVTDGSNSTTYEVTATPGTPGANNAITHTATFVAQRAATYSVTAKLYNGKFIDNFEGSASAWSGLGYGTCERVSNVGREADNGSTKVMKITRSVVEGHGEVQETAWTTTEENSGTKTSWGHEYGYIHMRYYAPQAETPEVEYWDDGVSVFKNTTLSSQTANTWHELVFAVNGGVVNYIHPFVLSGGKTDGHCIYIDDIILSNRSTWAPIKNTSGVDLTADASDVTIRDEYTVTLDNREAATAGTKSVTATYDATLSAITIPTKAHYDFGGYWTSSDDGSTLTTQLIDANGNWIKNVTGYTGASGDDPTWVHADDITLYAKWTEHEYAITIAVTGSGSTSPASSTTAKYVTASGDISAIPASGYSFRDWDFSKTDAVNDIYCADTYTSTSNPVHIHAVHDGTLTANFIANGYTVSLENEDADEDHKGTETVNVTYSTTTGLTSPITKPEKAHYDFGGYYTSNDEGVTLGTQLIDENGNWKKSISGYTGADGNNPTWVYAGDLTLYAKWTEHPYTITLAVDPTAGTVQIGGNAETSVNAHWVTESAEITAVPASPAYIFKQWQFSKTGEEYDVFVSDDDTYHSTDATIKIKASHNGTLTAIFEPRYCLVGSLLNDDLAGMPGWKDYDNSATFFTVNSITPSLNLTCARTLHPNSTYKFEVHDRKAGANYGYGEGTSIIDGSQSFNTQDRTVLLQTKGRGEYTFTISAITESGGKYYPTVSVSGPTSHLVNIKWADVDIDGNWWKTSRSTGGTVAAEATEGGSTNPISDGQYVAAGGSITYTATPATGYSFGGWWNTGWSNKFSDTNPYTSSSISTTQNFEAKFDEKYTTVTINTNNSAGGSITVGGSAFTWGNTKTAGVTTKRALVISENTGYNFTGWALSSTPDFELQEQSGDTDKEVTLAGKGGTNGSTGTLTANFSANNYTITLDDKHGGKTSASVTYDATSLTSITHATFSGWTLLGYWNADGNKVIEANGDIVANVVNYTGPSHEWRYNGDVDLYAHWSRTITLNEKEGSSPGSVTVNYDESTTASLSAPSRTGYHVEGYYADNDRTHKVMEANGTLVNYTGYVESGKWVHATATTLYTKWAPNEYTVTLDPREVESGDEGTPSVTVYYETSTNMTSAITKPTKAHYTFLGYYTGYDDVNKVVTGSKLIDGNGNWIKDVTGFTGHDGDNPTWVYVGGHTLYADWTETMYPVAIAISPAGAGNVQVSGETVTEVTAGYATHSPEMTAVPANAAWVFKEWQVSSASLSMDLEHYTTTGTSMQVISVAADQTLTAVFEPRFYLVGGEIMSGEDGVGTGTSSGMPGWDNYNKPFEIVTNSPILATCSLTLGTNKNFYIMVRDKADGFSYGKSGGVSLGDGTSLKFENKDNRVLFYSNGGTDYTFKITAIDGSGRPTVSVERPYQVNIGRKRVDIDGNDHDDNTGGTVDLSKQTAPETWTPISNGDWVPYGISVKYNADKATGYDLAWYNSSDYSYSHTTAPYWFHTATSTGNGYAKFTEKSTSVTLSNDGHGKIQIGGVDATSTTCGVTTTRELTAVPNEGYKFSSWTHVSGDDIELSSTSTNPTTLTGVGGGVSSGQEVRANFIERWIVQPEVGKWGYAYFTIEHIEEVGGKTIGYVDITLEANTNYQFSVVDRDGDVKYKNGSDQVYFMTNGNSHNWGFATDKSYYCGITTAGAGVYRFTWNITDKKMTVTYPNFIIYRTGDKAGDERATEDDVESYAGGTISEAIEFRMKVNRLDKWYTLCLPFTVTAVKVWDEEDGQYYDIVPYWRIGGTYYTGHYIIRTPVSTTDFDIENFDSRDRWVDPSSSDGYLPSANTPYIIQWHDSWFQDKYISFFSPTGESIPTSMDQGANTSSDETVNIYGNNCMTSGTVRDAYMLDPDYGSGGAWMREEVGTDRTVLPFECFIRANATTTAKYRVLRRDMADTPTGLDTVSETENKTTKVLIDNNIYIIREGRIYTIQGTLVKEGK